MTLFHGGRRADARSSVAIMLLGAQAGAVLTVEAVGPGAEEDARAVAALVGAAGTGAPRAARPEGGAPRLPTAAASVPLDGPDVRRLLAGVPAAPGLALGRSHRLLREDLDIREEGEGAERQRAALADALARTRAALERAIHGLGAGAEHGSHGPQQAEILGAHLSFLEDPQLQAAADALIAEGRSAAFAWRSAVDAQVAALRQLGNEVLAERAADLVDIQRRVLLVLCGRSEAPVALPERAILFADDLLPSQFAELDLDRVAGICLAASGPTSHVAILSASHGIAAVVAAGPDILRVPDGQVVVLDADRGEVSVNPPQEQVSETRARLAERGARQETRRRAAAETCRMADGTRIEVVANLGALAEVAPALVAGAEGCGLLRSEFLFLHRETAPGEDEQHAEYQAIADALDGRPLIIRTLDAGADKDVPYAQLPQEENPALGLRGVRLGLWKPDLLRTQVRAILRVRPYGQCRILLPMIATVADLRTVRAVIDAEAQALGRDAPIEVGIMVEVPSVALIARQFAREADFFSVGTNDLTQYTLAMDRCNARLAQQLDPFHPAVLRLVGLAAEGARAHGRWVGVCGNLASSPLAAPLLIGLGVTELSASAGAIADIKAVVRNLDADQCRAVAEAALNLDSAEAVRQMLASCFPDLGAA
ncbi:phosphoenolpyruvate-protein phosphotransferase [Methylobacterium sp. 4-46]|nr:phosphoenolpyruvate-protein phosphotransferase [Methylobacterium sp. 4-46]